ncbi:MAG: hypothetical protein AB7F22_28930 [Reyranella sp.]|uniref:hypothetical protein n=1 Tax=Reyranella sp. TaxID=1929291 RepID=UPI003D0A9F46
MSDDIITRVKREKADNLFREHVQSVAFHLTLSRQMIDALQIVRDTDEWVGSGALSGFARWVPATRAIERRGLIFHDWREGWPKHHRIYQLTKAGELVCELCVEAGLMPALRRAGRSG